jgi:hypothetical protein
MAHNLLPVEAIFSDITVHVVQSPGVGLLLPYRVRVQFAVLGCVFAVATDLLAKGNHLLTEMKRRAPVSSGHPP